MVGALRPWQTGALRAVAHAWQAGDRALVVAATGAGKSRVLTEIVRRCRDAGRGRTLALAPLIGLVDQAAEALAAADVSAEVEQGDRLASIFPSLFGGSDCVVACPDSLVGRRLERWPAETFSRVIVDEAHAQTGPTTRGILRHFSAAKVLGVTATPDGRTVGLYGQPVFTYGIEAGIRDGVLCPVVSRAIRLDTLSLDGVKLGGKDLDPEELGRAFTPTRETILATCAVVAREATGRQMIAFLPTVEAAHAYRYEMGSILGPDRVDSLDGTTPPLARERALARFRAGELRALFNCALFTTGVDLPSASCVAVLRPTKSTPLFRQMVGRGLRAHPGKQDCLVLTVDLNLPSLCGTVDLFEELPPGVRERAQRALMAGEDAARVVGEARERAEVARAALERHRARRTEVRAEAQVIETNLFAAAGVERDRALATGPRITDAQADALQRAYGGPRPNPRRVSQRQYRALMDPVRARQKAGLCTVRQSIILQKNGLPGDLPFGQARAALDALATEKGWRKAR